MRLASVLLPGARTPEERLDGRLVVVGSDGTSGRLPDHPACRTLRSALDQWATAEPVLRELSSGRGGEEIDLAKASFLSPLPRATDFVDGSSYLEHVRRVRRARNAEPPPDLETNPLMYRGIPTFLPPVGDIPVTDFTHGADCEGELAVIVGDVPAGVTPAEALACVRLVTQLNDVSLRELIKRELPKQFGFLASKPPSSAGPFAVTLDEIGEAWNTGRPRLTMRIERNGERMGELDTSELHFSIGELIAHAAATHPLGAGTIIGTGTVSNADQKRGVACIAESVALDTIDQRPVTPYLRAGEEVTIETTLGGRSLFGRIRNRFMQAMAGR